jgi:hypothetical protein
MSDDETVDQDAPGKGEPLEEEVKPAKGKSAKPADEKPAKEKKPPKDKKAAKDKKGAKATDKKPKGKKAAGGSAAGPSVAGHPRAGGYVRRARGWGGLGGFAIAAYLSMRAGVPTYDVGIRALAAGAAGYMLAWACSVTVCRHLVLAEMRVAVERSRSERLEPARTTEGKGTPRRDRP